MPNFVLYSLRVALLVAVATVLVLTASFYASLYVRSLIIETGAAAAVGVIGALFAVLLLVFVTSFGVAWTAMFLRDRHSH
jgi:hypothetical protein